jgi:hypothetical protein
MKTAVEAQGAHGPAAHSGVLLAPRLQAARLPAAAGDVHLVPRPRGAFSDLVAVPVDRFADICTLPKAALCRTWLIIPMDFSTCKKSLVSGRTVVTHSQIQSSGHHISCDSEHAHADAPRRLGAQLAPHEVALRVTAVGLNFRDVLNVLGMYPGDPGDPGGDVAGIVTAAGAAAALTSTAAMSAGHTLPAPMLQCDRRGYDRM